MQSSTAYFFLTVVTASESRELEERVKSAIPTGMNTEKELQMSVVGADVTWNLFWLSRGLII